jgi:hypothetical protein
VSIGIGGTSSTRFGAAFSKRWAGSASGGGLSWSSEVLVRRTTSTLRSRPRPDASGSSPHCRGTLIGRHFGWYRGFRGRNGGCSDRAVLRAAGQYRAALGWQLIEGERGLRHLFGSRPRRLWGGWLRLHQSQPAGEFLAAAVVTRQRWLSLAAVLPLGHAIRTWKWSL